MSLSLFSALLSRFAFVNLFSEIIILSFLCVISLFKNVAMLFSFFCKFFLFYLIFAPVGHRTSTQRPSTVTVFVTKAVSGDQSDRLIDRSVITPSDKSLNDAFTRNV